MAIYTVVDLPIKMVMFHSYLKLQEGIAYAHETYPCVYYLGAYLGCLISIKIYLCIHNMFITWV
jgi:hypothetical protein